jgi:hypothetical protein
LLARLVLSSALNVCAVAQTRNHVRNKNCKDHQGDAQGDAQGGAKARRRQGWQGCVRFPSNIGIMAV